MTKRNENSVWIEWICSNPKCRSLRTVLKTDPKLTGPFTDNEEYWKWKSERIN